MKRHKKKIFGFLTVLALASSFTLSSGAWADDVKYIYYPSSEVYYNPTLSRYYYRDWVERPVAPVGVTLGNGVNINLGGLIPYTYHTEVIRQYPRPAVVVTP